MRTNSRESSAQVAARPASALAGGGSWTCSAAAGGWADASAVLYRLVAMLAATVTVAAVCGAVAPSLLDRTRGSDAPASTGAWPDGLRETAEAAIEAESYQAVAAGGAWNATNQAQGYGATFSPAGVALRPVHGDEAWTWSLALAGVGRAGTLAPLAPADVTAVGPRVEYRRGPLTEWYVNDKGGIEQGFTVSERPAGTGSPLVVEMATSGSLVPRLVPGGQAVALDGPGGATVLNYEALHVFDSAGAEVPARLGVDGIRISITVDDGDAAYPLTIDPVIAVQQARLSGSNTASGDRQGRSVAVSGDTAVVGAPFYDTAGGTDGGSVLVFVRTETTWSQQARLFASDGLAGDWFGQAVAVVGDTLVVGAPHDDTAGGDGAGSAYVFARSGATWTEQAHLFPSDPGVDDDFGQSVAVAGDTAVVGAPGNDTGVGSNAGSAYVFRRSGSVWAQQQQLFGAGVGDAFGNSVALSGNTAVVGASADGSAYVFFRDSTVWLLQQKLLPSDGGGVDAFGFSVAISGDTVVVGAPQDDTAAGTDAGSAYVYARSGTTWTEQAHLFASDGAAGDVFGWSTAVSSDTAVVGASGDDTPAGTDAGSAYVYVRSGSAWSERARLFPSNPDPAAFFGLSVGVSGDTAVVGASGENASAAEQDTGAAYVYVPGTFSIGDVTVTEGNSGTVSAVIPVTRTGPLTASATVEVHTADGSATTPSDYTEVAKTVTFLAGQATRNVVVAVTGDAQFEPGETFFAVLTNPSGLNIGDGVGIVTIANDDASPAATTLSVNDVTVAEGNSGTTSATFQVTRAGDTSGTSTVSVRTEDGSATAASRDYSPVVTSVTFSAGQATKNVTVAITGDTAAESDESFFVVLHGATGATIADGVGQGTITNDECAGGCLVLPKARATGVDGGTRGTVIVVRSGDPSRQARVTATTVRTRRSGPSTSSATVTFAPGETAKQVTVPVGTGAGEVFLVLSNASGAQIADGSTRVG